MENAVEALKMAAAVLVFVIALGISISSFSEVRQVSETVINYNDREFYTDYVKNNNGSTERIISAETMIPAIYRAYKENYIIIIEDSSLATDGIYKKDGNPVMSIDLETGVELANDKQKDDFIRAVLYGQTRVSNFDDIKSTFSKIGITLANQRFI